jgi:hypothetical protein
MLTFFYMILCLFAVYGIIVIIAIVLDDKNTLKCFESENVRIEIHVKNMEQHLEPFVNEMINKLPVKTITFIDDGSTDNTMDILRKLEECEEKVKIGN